MIALDTNVVLRLIVEDDPGQLAVAREVVGAAEAAGETCLLSDVVLCEIEWVLLSAYGANIPLAHPGGSAGGTAGSPCRAASPSVSSASGMARSTA